MPRIRELAPGLIWVAVATAIAFLVNELAPLISALLVAVVLGALGRNLGLIPAAANPGVAFSAKKLLRAGVVILGFQLSLPAIAGLGWGVVVVLVATVVLTFLGTVLLGRAMGLPPAQRILVATGTSICGASAIAAMTAVVRPTVTASGEGSTRGPGSRDGSDDATGDASDDDDLDAAAGTAIAAVTVFGAIAMLALPAIAGALDMSALRAGTWIGAAVHEVGTVVAAGAALGEEALQTAVLTKLGRVLTLAPMVVLVGLALARRARAAAVPGGAGAAASGAADESGAERPPLVPLFVAGFLATVVLRSILGLPDDHVLVTLLTTLATLLLTAAMVGLGAGIRVRALVATGGPMLALTAIASLIAAAVSFLGVLLIV